MIINTRELRKAGEKKGGWEERWMGRKVDGKKGGWGERWMRKGAVVLLTERASDY
jgi:hypothetical protein